MYTRGGELQWFDEVYLLKRRSYKNEHEMIMIQNVNLIRKDDLE